MAIQNNPLFTSLLLQNPQLATLIDGAATLLKKTGNGNATATATATATAGGATATATANVGGGQVTAQGGAAANQAGKNIGVALGQLTGEALKRAPDGALGQFTVGLVEGLAEGLTKAFAPSTPSTNDNCPYTDPATGVPSQLKVGSDGKITTAGGYTIEATTTHEWIVTGPDGSKTRVWGDPHVETHGATGGEKFDFKKNTTFVLPDGTKINVKTTPWQGNQNFTVTQSLEIIQGNDRVEITGIDQGKGKVGQLTHGAQARETYDTEQTFVAGKNVADWFWSGHEIKGNNNGAPDAFMLDMERSGFNDISNDAFLVGGYVGNNKNGAGKNKTFYGDDLQNFRATVQAAQGGRVEQVLQQVLGILPQLINLLSQLRQSYNPYNPPAQQTPQPAQTQQPKPTTTPPYNPQTHSDGLRQAFAAIGAMLQILGQMMQLMSAVNRRPVGNS